MEANKISKSRVHWGRLMVAVILGFFIAEGFIAFGRKIVLERRIHNRLTQTQNQLSALRDENDRLRHEKEALHTPEKIEELAREKLDLTKPDEIAVKVITRQSPSDGTPEEEKAPDPPKTFWEKLKEELPLKWLLKLEPS